MNPDEIKAKRETLGLTLEEMAHRLDVTLNTVWRWEQGRHAPTKRLQKAIRRLK